MVKPHDTFHVQISVLFLKIINLLNILDSFGTTFTPIHLHVVKCPNSKVALKEIHAFNPVAKESSWIRNRHGHYYCNSGDPIAFALSSAPSTTKSKCKLCWCIFWVGFREWICPIKWKKLGIVTSVLMNLHLCIWQWISNNGQKHERPFSH